MSINKNCIPQNLEAKMKAHYRKELEELKNASAYLVGHRMDEYDALFTDDKRYDSKYLKAQMGYMTFNVGELIIDGYKHFFTIYREGANNWFCQCVHDQKISRGDKEISLWLFVAAEDKVKKADELLRVESLADEVVYCDCNRYADIEKEVLNYVSLAFSMYGDCTCESIVVAAKQAGVEHMNGSPSYLLEEMLLRDSKES